MSNPIDDLLNDPDINSSGVTDFAKRMRLWMLMKEHFEFKEEVRQMIIKSDMSHEKKTKMIMWLFLEIDFMVKYPDDYLEIYDEQL